MNKNPADLAAEIIKEKVAESGIELANDFDEQIARMRAHYNELIPADNPLQGFSNESSLRRYNEMVDDFCARRWTIEFPTKYGFYWIRNWITKDRPNAIREPLVVRIVGGYFGSDYQFCLTGNDGLWGPDELISAEWYGPLEPPE